MIHRARHCVAIQLHSLCDAHAGRGCPCGDENEEARIYQGLIEKAWTGQVWEAAQTKGALVILTVRGVVKRKGDKSVKGLSSCPL